MSTATLYPNADGSQNEWALAANYYTYLIQDTATYRNSGPGSNANNTACICNLDAFGNSGVTIDSVKVICNIRSSAGTITCRPALYINSTKYTSDSDSTASTTLAPIEYTWTTNPDTSAAWDPSEVDALEAGVNVTAATSTNRLRIYELSVVVTYSSGSPAPITPAILSAKLTKADPTIIRGSHTVVPSIRSSGLRTTAASLVVICGSVVITPTIISISNQIINPTVLPLQGTELIAYPAGDGSTTQWTASAGNKWDCVNDSDVGGSPDDDTTYVYKVGTSTGTQYFTPTSLADITHSATRNDEVLAVAIKLRVRHTAGSASTWYIRPRIYSSIGHSGTTTFAVKSTYTTSDWIDIPRASGSWSYDDLASMQFGFDSITTTSGSQYRVTDVQLKITYRKHFINTPAVRSAALKTVNPYVKPGYELFPTGRSCKIETSTLGVKSLSGANGSIVLSGTVKASAPTVLLCERETEPTNCSDSPIFSALANYGTSWVDTVDSSSATGNVIANFTYTQAYIQVSTASDFSTEVWRSGWLTLTTAIANAQRIVEGEVKYNGINLSSATPWYYWRVKLRGTLNTDTAWSSTYKFKGVDRLWWNEDYNIRQKLSFDGSHSALDDSFTAAFNIKTGNLKKIASNAMWNWEPPNVARFGDISHVVYLGEDSTTNELSIYTISYNHITEEWGTVIKIDDAYTPNDTHHYPNIVVNKDGKIFVFYGCHGTNSTENTQLHWAHSTVTNSTGSFGGTSTMTIMTPINNLLTYPWPFTFSNTSNVFVALREGADNNVGYKIVVYTINGLSHEYGKSTILYNDSASGYIVDGMYLNGLRVDSNNRLHVTCAFITSGSWGTHYFYTDDLESWYEAGGATPIGLTSTGGVKRSVVNSHKNIPGVAFAKQLGLTKNNEPIIETARVLAGVFNAYIDASALDVSIYTGGEWVYHDLSSEHKIIARSVTCAIDSDPDGTIHLFYPENSNYSFPYAPTATGSVNSNCSRSTGASHYLCVDDDPLMPETLLDYTTDYLYPTTVASSSTWSVSFTSTIAVATGTEILGVTVRASVAKCAHAFAGYILYLKIGGTIYNGATLLKSVDGDYGSTTADFPIQYTWIKNPATGLDWTPAEVNAIEYGIKITEDNKDVRLFRIGISPKEVRSSSRHNYNSEVVELVTSDHFTTVKKRYISGNSHIGVPSIAGKGVRSGNALELVWIAGKDLFYWASTRPYKQFRSDCRDLRVVYSTRTAHEELHRVIDFGGIENTTVKFKLPCSIASGLSTGDGDIYVYGSNLNATNSAASDPHDVWPVLFDNCSNLPFGSAQQGVHGVQVVGVGKLGSDTIDGVDGWEVLEGVGYVASSDAFHVFNMADGDRAIIAAHVDGDEFIAEKLFSASQSSFNAQCSIYTEGTLGVFSVTNGTNEFGARLNVYSGTNWAHPSSDIVTGWTASAGSRYSCINEAGLDEGFPISPLMPPRTNVINDDTSYIYCVPTSTKTAVFGLSAHNMIADQATQEITVTYRARKTASTGTWKVRPFVRINSGATVVNGAEATLTSSYQDIVCVISPPTGLEWSQADLDGMQLGFENTTIIDGTSDQIRITSAYVAVLNIQTVDYLDNDGWHRTSMIPSNSNMYEIKLQVLNSFGKVWVNGVLLADGVDVISSADRVRIRGLDTTTFDRLKVEKIVANTPIITVGTEQVRGLSVSAAILGSGQDQVLVSGKVDGTERNSGSWKIVRTAVVNPIVIRGSMSFGGTSDASLTATDPTIILGSAVITDDVDASLISVNPTVEYGSVIVEPSVSCSLGNTSVEYVRGAFTPDILSVAVSTIDPTVIRGSMALDDVVSVVVSTVDPVVIRGSLALTGISDTSIVTVDPIVINGNVVISVSASCGLTTIDPTFVRGSIVVTDSVDASIITSDPTVHYGDVVLTDIDDASLVASDPSFIRGSIVIQPSVSAALVTSVTVVRGSLSLVDQVDASLVAIDPVAYLGSAVLSDSSDASLVAIDPTVIRQSMVVSDTATSSLIAIDPTVINGDVAITDTCDASLVVTNPTVENGSVVLSGVASVKIRTVNPIVAGSSALIEGKIAYAVLTTTSATTIIGSISLSDTAQTSLITVTPTTEIGSIAITDQVDASLVVTGVSVVRGSLAVSNTVDASLVTSDPSSIRGSLACTDSVSTAVGTSVSIEFGSVVLSGTVDASLIVVNPIVAGSSAEITPTPMTVGTETSVSYIRGSLSTTDSVSASIGVSTEIVLGNVIIIPSVVTTLLTTSNPIVVGSSTFVSPSVSTGITTSVTVIRGSFISSPSVTTVITTGSSSYVLGSAVATNIVSVSITTTNPSALIGLPPVVPESVSSSLTTTDPLVILGSISVSDIASVRTDTSGGYDTGGRFLTSSSRVVRTATTVSYRLVSPLLLIEDFDIVTGSGTVSLSTGSAVIDIITGSADIELSAGSATISIEDAELDGLSIIGQRGLV